MTFDARILSLAERVLCDRTVRLIVEPALADLQFEDGKGTVRRQLNRLAVLRAVAGGLRDDLARDSGSFVLLALVSACYYTFMLVICFDVFSISISTGFLVAAGLILILSFGPVMACFWPEGPAARRVD